MEEDEDEDEDESGVDAAGILGSGLFLRLAFDKGIELTLGV